MVEKSLYYGQASRIRIRLVLTFRSCYSLKSWPSRKGLVVGARLLMLRRHLSGVFLLLPLGILGIFDAMGLLAASRGKHMEAFVEQVGDGSTIRVYLLPELQFVQVSLLDSRCVFLFLTFFPYVASAPNGAAPRGPLTSAQRLAASAVSSVEVSSDPFAMEAKYFTELRVPNRDVRRNCNKGLAKKYVEWSANMMEEEAKKKLKAAELLCKKKRVKMWVKYYCPWLWDCARAIAGKKGIQSAKDSSVMHVTDLSVASAKKAKRFSPIPAQKLKLKLWTEPALSWDQCGSQGPTQQRSFLKPAWRKMQTGFGADKTLEAHLLELAERSAKKQKLKIWENYVEGEEVVNGIRIRLVLTFRSCYRLKSWLSRKGLVVGARLLMLRRHLSGVFLPSAVGNSWNF
ncbi:TUDOR-SN protein 2 [Raphanus sativus]|nr:TUDOR-SN protein 2 [Raphanus sativus]